jgi:hypothetical protein
MARVDSVIGSLPTTTNEEKRTRMEKQQAAQKGLKCRNSYCPNFYSDVIGKAGWTQRKELKGAECIPCLYANQMFDHGTTPEKVEAVPQLMKMFDDLLTNTGWTWQHVKDSYLRVKTAATQAAQAAG